MYPPQRPDNLEWLGRIILIILLIIAALVLGYAAAHCQENDPNLFIMQDYNLRCAESLLQVMGHEVKVFDGVAIGTEDQRKEGTALAIIRARTVSGQWFNFMIASERGRILKVRTYPIPAPAGWRGD